MVESIITEGMCWLILFVMLVVIEIVTLGLTTIWFAAGCLVAFVLSLFHISLPVQIFVFLTVSVLLFILTRPVAIRYFNKDRARTNVESVIGRSAVVLETIDNVHAKGRVELDGMEWSARSSLDTETYQKDEVVRITDVQGVKLIVEHLHTEDSEKV
ncbi:MAG: NfeD family protein [Hespellia sp.]|nr:NfeD family protein [Hespellia sp.]